MITTLSPAKAQKLRVLAFDAYWAASTPTEAKMAGILMDLFAPDAERATDKARARTEADVGRAIETVAPN